MFRMYLINYTKKFTKDVHHSTTNQSHHANSSSMMMAPEIQSTLQVVSNSVLVMTVTLITSVPIQKA